MKRCFQVWAWGWPPVFLLTGCALALRPYNPPTRQALHIRAASPERCVIRVGDGPEWPVPRDGQVAFEVPRLPRGCTVYFLGLVKVADHRSEEGRGIQVIRDGRVLRRLSLNQISELPAGPDGTRVLQLK